MGIATFFDKTVVVHRLRPISGSRTGFQATATVDGAIQELDRESRVAQGVLDERVWIGYFELNAPIQEGDVISRQDTGMEFTVVEITQKDYGINQHLQVMMVEHNA